MPVFDIGDARSLPWGEGQGWNRPRADYARERLIPDTLELLAPKTPVLVRMETLRRANLYTRLFADAGHPEVADALLARLQARALDSEARGAPDPLAYFDAGYFAESLKHWSARHRDNLDGYAWVRSALQARGEDPEMEFAAVLDQAREPHPAGCPLAKGRRRQRPERPPGAQHEGHLHHLVTRRTTCRLEKK